MRSADTEAKQIKNKPDRQNRSDANRNIHAGLPKPAWLAFMLVQRNVVEGARKRQTLGSIKFGLDPLPIRTFIDYVKFLLKSNARSLMNNIFGFASGRLSRTGEGRVRDLGAGRYFPAPRLRILMLSATDGRQALRIPHPALRADLSRRGEVVGGAMRTCGNLGSLVGC
jgi:hypothetical protein